jgi:hypothetical protein
LTRPAFVWENRDQCCRSTAFLTATSSDSQTMAVRLWLFDRKTLQHRAGTPFNTGVQTDFYTATDADGTPGDSVEKILSSVEGKVWS